MWRDSLYLRDVSLILLETTFIGRFFGRKQTAQTAGQLRERAACHIGCISCDDEEGGIVSGLKGRVSRSLCYCRVGGEGSKGADLSLPFTGTQN